MTETGGDPRERPASGPSSPWVPYVPRHVIEEIVRRHPDELLGKAHRFSAATMFADISGFTATSEALAREGKRGTEELTELLNDYFGTMIDMISSYGGSVAKFGGDAIVVLFASGTRAAATVRRAATCALGMQDLMPRYRSLPTSAGAFDLEFKAGLGHGRLVSTTVGHADARAEHVVMGPAIQACVEAEHRAAAGQVVLHPSAASLLEDGDRTPLADGYAIVERLHPRSRRSSVRELGELPEGVGDRLAAYLHPVIAERIRTGHGRFVNEHRRVCALFAAFESDHAGDDPFLLQSFLSPVLGVIGRLDGHLLQVDIGDKGRKAMALFGVPTAHEDDEERALRCALRIRELVAPGGARIGVASGSVFCGDIGGRTRREYTAIGDTINLAARLMQAAEPGGILVARVPDRVLAGFDTRPVDAVSLKGKTDPVAAVSLLSVAPPLAASPVRSDDAPILGRRAELRRIVRRLDAAARGRGCTIAIVGEAGIGKSRLAQAVERKATERSFSCHVGVCQSQGERTPYLPWRGLIRSLLDLDASRPAWEQIALLRSRLQEMRSDLVARMPLLGPALNLSIADNDRTAGLEPELRAELLATLVGEIVRHRARRGPQLLVVEDVHWIDPASSELLASAARSIERLPVALVLVSRTETGGGEPVAWTRSLPEPTQIALDGLDAHEARRLATRTLMATFGETAPDQVLDLLVERADGNPFYLEETVYLLHDRGVDPGDVEGVGALELPDTLGRLVLARIDTLAPEESAILKAASTIGRRFPAQWVEGCFPDLGTPEQTRGRLDRLRHVGLLRDGGGGELEFRHAVVRDAAYDTLTIALRSDLHERVGRFVEATYADEPDRFVDLLAYQFGESRDHERQRIWFRRAADRAAAAFSNDTALSWLERLLPLCAGAEQAGVRCDIGEIAQLVGRWPDAERSFLAGLESAKDAHEPLAIARCRSRLGYLHVYTGSFDDARRELVEAHQLFVDAGDLPGLLMVLEYLAFVTAQAADHRASLAYSREHLALAEESGDEIAACMATEQIGLVLSRTGDDEGAHEHLARALEIAERRGYVRGIIMTCNDLAGLYAERGDHVRAFPFVKRAFDAAREIGDRHAAGVLTLNAAEIYRQHADPDRALACAAAAVEAMRELGDWADLASGVANIASALAAAGRTAEARTFSELSVEMARAVDDPYLLADCLHELARLTAEAGRPGRARAMNAEALALAAEIDWPDVRLRARILDVELTAHDSPRGRDDALARLRALEDPAAHASDRAALERSRARFGDEQARQRAVARYRDLWLGTSNAEYAGALEELTGERPPEPQPLPSLDEDLGDADLEHVLIVAREVLTRISAASTA